MVSRKEDLFERKLSPPRSRGSASLRGQTRSLTALESPPGSRLPICITMYVTALANGRSLVESPTFG